MLCIKKVYRDELLQLALIISLLRVNQDSVFDNDILNGVNDFDNGTTWRSALSPTVLRSHYVHPKSLDSVLLNYERDLFADLNSLGRYNRGNFRHPDVHAYLLNIERNAAGVPLNNEESLTSAQNDTTAHIPDVLTPPSEVSPDGLELSQEDMDLIEVLWKQDVDLGFSLELARQEEQLKEKTALEADALKADGDPSTSLLADEDDEGLKLEKDEKIKEEEPDSEPPEEDIWAGVDYTIDTETGEYVIKGEPGAEANSSCALEDLALPLPEFLLDEALRLVELEDESSQQKNASGLLTGLEALENSTKKPETSGSANSSSSDIGDDFDIFAEMIQTPQFHHPHHRAAFQSRMPFVRTVSMEQRWQDLANLLSLPNPGEIHPFGAHHALPNYGHPHAHAHPATTYDARGVLLHNATLPTPMGDLNSSMPYGNLGGTISNAVATSMNLTNSSEPMGEPSSAPHYKLEPSNDMMYYQNNTGSEFSNNQTDGFLSNLLNDEDLQLMDMAMNEGMYTMRMLESNNAVSNMSMNNTAGTTSVSRHDMERLDTSSDSAVSSMGSERVPSLSDGEWCDAGSDSGHTTNGEAYSQDYQNKYRPFDYSYSNRLSENARMNPVPQKKHLMYGKRFHTSGFSEYRDPTNSFQQENAAGRAKMPEIKYSCSAEFTHLPRTPVDHIQHNHTYHLPAESSGPMQRPVSRDKGKSRRSEEEHLSRDEKRARALSIPITVDDIINLPMDEFNERLSKYDLSEAQLSLIRDIRRRGKNKVAAQNCRKRKLDQILSLADEVKEMRDRKLSIMNEHKYSLVELKRMKDKYQQLYRHVFQNLRDADGNQYSPYQYSLQTAADGSILMVPRSSNAMNGTTERKDPPQNQKD